MSRARSPRASKHASRGSVPDTTNTTEPTKLKRGHHDPVSSAEPSSDGTLSGVALGDLYSHLNGDTANVVRCDTPVIAGFVLSASWGEDDMWDAGAKYEGDVNSIKIAASIAYTRDTDENGLDGGGGAALVTPGIENFQTVVVGTKISF